MPSARRAHGFRFKLSNALLRTLSAKAYAPPRSSSSHRKQLKTRMHFDSNWFSEWTTHHCLNTAGFCYFDCTLGEIMKVLPAFQRDAAWDIAWQHATAMRLHHTAESCWQSFKPIKSLESDYKFIPWHKVLPPQELRPCFPMPYEFSESRKGCSTLLKFTVCTAIDAMGSSVSAVVVLSLKDSHFLTCHP